MEKVTGSEVRTIEGAEINFGWERDLSNVFESVACNGSKKIANSNDANISARFNLADKKWSVSNMSNLTATEIKNILTGCESAIAEIKVAISTKLITTTPSA